MADVDLDDVLNRPYAGHVALAWASLGARVLPFRFVGALKRPSMRAWPERATTDREELISWWDEHGPYRRSLAGLATGAGSGFWVLDVDVKHGHDGRATLTALEAKHGPLPRTFTVRTPSGGEQRYFRYPTDGREVKNSASAEDLGDGLDVRGWHGYVVAPGTWRTMADGTSRPYEVIDAEEWVDAPDWLLDRVVRRPNAGYERGDDETFAAPLDVDDWVARAHEVGEPNARADGSQEWYLFTGLCSLRARGAEIDELVQRATEVVARFVTFNVNEPWTVAHAVEKARHVADRYPPYSTAAHVDAVRHAEVVTLDAEDVRDLEALDALEESPRRVVVGEPPDEGLSDLGNARRFARLLGDRVRFVHTGRNDGHWLIWDGDRWAVDLVERVVDLSVDVVADVRRHAARLSDPDARQRLTNWATRLEDVGAIGTMLRRARALPQLALRPDQVDTHRELLATPGGRTVNVLTGEVRPSRPADLLTRRTNVEYDPDAWSEPLREFLATFMPESHLADYLFRQLGSTLVGDNRLRHLIIIIGGTTSGKSQLIGGVAAALGDYAVPIGTSVFRGNQDDKPRPDLLAALPARLAYAEEASKAWELHTDQIKRLTSGGADVVARRMRSDDMLAVEPAFTPLVVTNQMPRIHGADGAIRRRLIALGFKRSLPPGVEDPSKRARFVGGRDTQRALLARLVAGCVAAHRDGLEDIPEEFALDTMESFDQLNHLGEFLAWLTDEGLLKEDDPTTTPLTQCWRAADLHGRYDSWLTFHGSQRDRREKLSLREFNDALKAQGWQTRRSNGTRWAGRIQVQHDQRALDG